MLSYDVKEGRPTSELGNNRQTIRFARKLFGTSLAVEFGPLDLTL